MYDYITGPARQKRAASNLTGLLSRVVELTGTDDFVDLAGAGAFHGILSTDAQSGEHVSIVKEGSGKVQVGGAVSVGDRLVSAASGYAVAAASGDALGFLFGRATTAAASGSIARFEFELLHVTSGGAL